MFRKLALTLGATIAIAAAALLSASGRSVTHASSVDLTYRHDAVYIMRNWKLTPGYIMRTSYTAHATARAVDRLAPYI